MTTERRTLLLGLLTVTAALAVVVGIQTSSATLATHPGLDALRQTHTGRLTGADGYLGSGTVTAYADVPAVTRLDPRLRRALQVATDDAAADGVGIRINSGWRSRAYQQRLLDKAVTRYGSLRAARAWVNTPDASTHVTGEAVDVTPVSAAAWLQRNGARYGLCRVYANEPWHFERGTSPGGSCPGLRADGNS